MFLGALNITMRRGLMRVPDGDAGAAVIATLACALVTAVTFGSGVDLDRGELWHFLLLGVFVPGFSQLLVVHAVRAAGASRAGILFGMAPLFSAIIAITAFGESLHWSLAVGTLLVVAGGVTLTWKGGRPAGYRPYGAVLALIVAAAFGLRDNVARAVGEDLAAEPLARATALMLGASMLLLVNLLRQKMAVRRLRATILAFAASGIVTAVAQATLLEALDRDPCHGRRTARGYWCALDGDLRGDRPPAHRAGRPAARGRCTSRGRRWDARRRNALTPTMRSLSGSRRARPQGGQRPAAVA